MADPSHHPSRQIDALALLLPRVCVPVSARVQVALERAIALGWFPEGRLPSERQLAASLEVSRTALRAALDLVRESGYAEQSLVGRSGGVPTKAVRPMTAQEITATANEALTEIDELTAVRRLIEPACARLAAIRPVDGLLERLIDSQERLVGAPTQLAHRMTDGEFHYELTSVSGSHEIVASVLRARADLLRWRDRLPMEDTIGHSVTEHWAVIDAIRDGDGEAAEAAMLRHLDSARDLYVLFLRRYLADPEIVLAEGEAAVARSTGPHVDRLVLEHRRWSNH